MDKVTDIEIGHTLYQEHARQSKILDQLNNFGVWMLNIQEAAELIARDMWCTGVIKVESLDDFSGSALDPEVKFALADAITSLSEKLKNAIEIGRLKAEHISRDLDENIIIGDTFVRIEPLEKWLDERGYSVGDIFSAWYDDEIDIANRIISELIWLRAAKDKAKDSGYRVGLTGKDDTLDESNHSELLVAYKSAVLENQHLRERLADAESRSMINHEQPLTSAKHRSTLLVVIGALCKVANHDVKKRGVAQRIKEMTEQIGAPVDDGTIRDIMADIPNAIERRSR